eukprot:scaffold27279_cov68-Phaeocystis_antarctica.AAC.1
MRSTITGGGRGLGGRQSQVWAEEDTRDDCGVGEGITGARASEEFSTYCIAHCVVLTRVRNAIVWCAKGAVVGDIAVTSGARGELWDGVA